MRRLLLISLATIPLTGCQFFNRGSDTAVIDPLDPASVGEAITGAANGGAAVDDTDGEAFADPTVESTESTVSADLIQSTDANARALTVQRSRNDPFASLPIPPPPEPAELPDSAAGNRAVAGGAGAAGAGRGSGNATRSANNGSGSAGGSAGRTANNGGRSAVASNRGGSSTTSSGGGAAGGAVATRPTPAPTPPPVRVQPANEPLVTPSPIAALPPVPQPVIAQTVSVSGVIQLGNEPYAILRSGSEPERYVKVGDRIAGGSVRVKRIETLAFEPSVILEENGIEVSRPITSGGSTANGATPDAPATVPPVPVPAVPAPSEQVGNQLGSQVSQARNQTSNQTLIPGLPVVPVSGASSALQPAPGTVPSSLTLLPS